MSCNSRLPGWRLERHGEGAELRLTGDWIARDSGVRDSADVRRILDEAGGLMLRVDASELGQWDSALIAFLRMLRDSVSADQTRIVRIEVSALPKSAQRLLALASAGASQAPDIKAPHASLATRVGEVCLRAWSRTVGVAAMVGETALCGTAAFAGRTRTRAVDVVELIREAGAGALGIVAIVNGLVGAILAFVGAVQLQRFGAGIYVADLVGVAMAREMAAIGTAIVMAGRTGGAYAAHLATMQGNEEIDALNVFGIPIFDFLVLPRITALVTMTPLLYIYGCAVGFFGGAVVSIVTLDITPLRFLEELRRAVTATQFAIGFTKSIAFGALVALAGCFIGLRAGRSAADVGHAATAAVVVGIIGVIALDAVFAVCCHALGI